MLVPQEYIIVYSLAAQEYIAVPQEYLYVRIENYESTIRKFENFESIIRTFENLENRNFKKFGIFLNRWFSTRRRSSLTAVPPYLMPRGQKKLKIENAH